MNFLVITLLALIAVLIVGLILLVLKKSKLTQKFLKDTELQYRELIDNSPDNIMLLNTAGFITYVNNASEITGGYLREDIVGKHLSMAGFFNPADIPAYMQVVTKVLSGQKVEGVEMKFVSKSGEPMVAQVSAGVIKTGGQVTGLQAVWRDVTQIKENERKITELNELLKILNKILRHDILNDITVIDGNLKLYLEYDTNDKSELETISIAADRSKKLIEQMRDLEGAVSSGKPLESINLRKVVDETKAEFPDLNIAVSGEALVLADAALGSLISNLFRNAIMHGSAKNMSVDIQVKDDVVVVRFADDGKGIPDDIKPKLFVEGGKFGETGHTGLGLYIIKKTLERYSGSVTIEDNHPQGAVFAVTLPHSNNT